MSQGRRCSHRASVRYRVPHDPWQLQDVCDLDRPQQQMDCSGCRSGREQVRKILGKRLRDRLFVDGFAGGGIFREPCERDRCRSLKSLKRLRVRIGGDGRIGRNHEMETVSREQPRTASILQGRQDAGRILDARDARQRDDGTRQCAQRNWSVLVVQSSAEFEDLVAGFHHSRKQRRRLGLRSNMDQIDVCEFELQGLRCRTDLLADLVVN